MVSALIDRCYRGIAPFVRLFTTGTDSARSIELGSVLASVVPASPQRSLLNSIVYDRANPSELASALPALQAEFAAAGVAASSIWVVEGDSEAEAIVVDQGFKLDSSPRAMGAEISALVLDADIGDVDGSWDMPTVAKLNERAYGLGEGEFGAVLDRIPPTEDVYCFTATSAQERVATVMTLHMPDGDCTVYFVATDPDHRRAGHARRAMTAALQHAKAAGCVTTTLQATKHGAPLYQLLGYQDLGVAVNLWEKRES